MCGDAMCNMLDDVSDPVLRTRLVWISEQDERRAGRQNTGNAAQVGPQSPQSRPRDEGLSTVQYDDGRRLVTHLRGQNAAVQPHRSNGTSADTELEQIVRYGVHALPPLKGRQHEP
ncbi:hypothetical protein WR30_18445 [Burkholderia contaminans FFH2055]|nr:hypothetical protein WR30_18445 [Burkholderia contaminans FFH2055]